MRSKKRTSPLTQLSFEGTPPAGAGGAKGARQQADPSPARGPRRKVAPAKRRPRTTGGARPETELAAAVRALEEVAAGLHFTHESFTQSLLRLPRAEDYEPLTDTLRRLAAAAPALLARAPAPPGGPADGPTKDPGSSARARSAILAARGRIEEALRGLPAAADYEPAARNLRELASVSPSLLEWLQEVPALATPLVDAVGELREAIVDLDRAFEALDEQASPSGIKVVVRS